MLEMLQENLMQTLSRDRDARVSQRSAMSGALASNGIALPDPRLYDNPIYRKACNARTQFEQLQLVLSRVLAPLARPRCPMMKPSREKRIADINDRFRKNLLSRGRSYITPNAPLP
jgi:hypothetical protein